MYRFVLLASLAVAGCGVQPVPEESEAVPISATAPVPPGADDPLTALQGKTPQERSPAYRKAPEADRAFDILDAAIAKAWSLDDPREPLAEVVRTAAEVDPVRTCDRVRSLAPRLWKLELPPARRVVWASFAAAVAAQDPNLRDGLLRLAVIDGRRALAEPKLWKAEPTPPGVFPRGDPQRLLDYERQLLEFGVRLWEAVIEQRADREAALDLATKLLADAKAKGHCWLGCISRNYEYDVADNLANLDPAFFLTVCPKDWGKERLAEFCAGRAYRRWTDRNRDSITKALVVFAADNGARGESALKILGHYDLARAWKLAVDLPDDGNNPNFPRLRPLCYLIKLWAWQDPEAAVAAAQREPVGRYYRQSLLDKVAFVCAYKQPEQIGRIVPDKNSSFRRMADEELERRKQGNPPRNSPETVPGWGSPEIAKPAGIPWVPPPDVQKLLDDPTKVAEADNRLCEIAQHIGQWGPADHALDVLNRVKSAYRYVNTASWVARNLIHRHVDD